MQNYKKNFVTRTLAWVLTVVMVVTMLPMGVFAEETSPVGQPVGLPSGNTGEKTEKTFVSAQNWEQIIKKEDDYWEIPKVEAGSINEEGQEVKFWKGRNMGGLTSVGYAMTELSYLGTYTDESGRDVIRLQLQADTRSYTGSWMDNVDLAFKFQKTLFDAIDWDKSYIYSAKGTEEKFNFNNVKASDYQAGISFTQINSGWLNKLYELPMNLVLKDGVKLESLGKKDFLIQHRALDTKNKVILTNEKGTQRDLNLNEIEYGQFTKSTIVPLNSNIKSDVIPANSNKESNRQRYGSSEYDNDRKVIKAKHYYRKSDSLDSYLGNVGFTQSFDARLMDLLKEDGRGNVAYLYVNTIEDEKAYGTTPNVAIRRDQINVKDGVATIYVVGSSFDQKLDNSGLKVVRATSGGIKTGIYSVLFKTATVNYVNTTVEYNVKEEEIAKLFPEEKNLESYAFNSGFIHENKGGFLRSNQMVDREIVIPKGSKLTLEFKDRINSAGNQYVMQIGETYHLMNDNSAPNNAKNFETITERNVGGILSSNRDMKYDINMVAGRTLHKGDPIKLWIINDNGQKYTTQAWKLFINTGNTATDTKIVDVIGDNFERDYYPYFFQHSKNVDGVMVTKYKYVPQVEEIFDNENQIVGTVRKGGNNVTGYYKAPDNTYYSAETKSENEDNGIKVILDANGKQTTSGSRTFEPVFKYALGKFKAKNDTELELKKDMLLYFNTARKGQFPSDPAVEPVQSVVTFDLNAGTLQNVKSFEGYKEKDKQRDGYKTERKSDTSSVKRIVPMNEKYADDDGYTPNGFTGPNIKNVAYEGDAAEIRKFLEFKNNQDKPKKDGAVFLGWTTKKLEGTPQENSATFKSLEVADTAEETNSDTNYIFNSTSPVTKSITVYAAYGTPLIKIHSNPPVNTVKEKEVLQGLTVENLNSREVTLQSVYNEFKVDGYSLVGFSRKKDATVPDRNVTGQGVEEDLYLRDGDTMPLTEEDTMNGLELYAVWKKNYHVDVTKKWVGDGLETNNKDKIYIGLLKRPAVGTQGHEVHSTDAVYRPHKGSLKKLSEAVNGKLEWTNLPSYDEKGHRMSYIAVEITESTKPLFEAGNYDYIKYGVTIKDADIQNGFYGGKVQLVNKDGVDAMSAATIRKHYISDENNQEVAVNPHNQQVDYFDTLGYQIELTNTKVDKQPPLIKEPIRDGENKVEVLKQGDPDGLVIELPGDKKITLKKEGNKLVKDDANTTSDANVVVDTEGNVTVTLKNGTFAEGQKIKAKQVYTVGDATQDSKYAEATVSGKLVSNKVVEIEQRPYDDKENIPVKFKVPNSRVTPPNAGTIYKLGYYDGETFVEVADPITLTEDIPSDKSTDVYKEFSIPAAKKNDVNGKNLVIKAMEKDKVPTDSDSFKLDLEAPEAKGKAEDELWRRWVNVELKDFKEDSDVITVDYMDINGKQTLRFTKQEAAAKELMRLKREGIEANITIVDKFGNKRTVKPEYNETKIIKILVEDPYIGDDFVSVKAYQDNTTVTVRIFNETYKSDVYNKTPGYEQKAKVTKTSSISKNKYTDIDLGQVLADGDIVEVIGTTPDGAYTNPYATIVRE